MKLDYLIGQRVGQLRLGDRASYQLDVMRGLAAVAVMVGHLRGLFFVQYADVLQPAASIKIMYFITGLGHQAVMVFFVLSGFLISGSVFKAMLDRHWSWRWYFTRRLSRLYIVLIPALCLTALWDQLGMKLFGDSGVYLGLPSDQSILNFSVPERSGFQVFSGNAFFLQEIVVPTFGSNGPLWSLAYEFWYYLLFPCLVLATVSSGQWWKRIWYGCAAAIIAFGVGGRISLYFMVWLFGVAVLLIPRVRITRTYQRQLLITISLTVFLSALTLSRFQWLGSGQVANFMVGFGCAMLMYTITFADRADTSRASIGTSRAKNLWTKLAGFSYTLYLVHLPPLVFLHAWVVTVGMPKWQPDHWHVLVALMIGLGILIYAWLISLITEEQTDRLRKLVEGFLNRSGVLATRSGIAN